MTPKMPHVEIFSEKSVLYHCQTLTDGLTALAKARQIDRNQKLESLLELVPITVRNWRRIISGEIVPSVATYNGFRNALCVPVDYDKFDAMYLDATLDKERFSLEDIAEMIRIGAGIKCSAADTKDCKLFREMIFSNTHDLESVTGIQKALSYYRAIRSLLISKRLPAHSELDRKIRIAITLYREGWVARTSNMTSLQNKLLRDIDSLGIDFASPFIRASKLDLKLLSNNNPDEVFFIEYSRPVVLSQMAGFRRVLELFQEYDASRDDPLKKYGFLSASEDATINMLRLMATCGKQEAADAVVRIKSIDSIDKNRNAPRFLTFYNDLAMVEALISVGKIAKAREYCDGLLGEAKAMKRGDLVGEVRMLIAKSYIKPKSARIEDFDIGTAHVEEVRNYFAELSNDVKVASLQQVLSTIEGVREMRFKC